MSDMRAHHKTHEILNGVGVCDDKNKVVDIEDLYGSKTAQTCDNCDAKKSKMYYFPFRRHLQKNEVYDYCRCGRSDNFPFCDHSHTLQDVKDGKGPIQFKILTKQHQYLLCGCRFSKSLPFCDGSHAFLSTKANGNSTKPKNKL
eukprot:670408_1